MCAAYEQIVKRSKNRAVGRLYGTVTPRMRFEPKISSRKEWNHRSALSLMPKVARHVLSAMITTVEWFLLCLQKSNMRKPE